LGRNLVVDGNQRLVDVFAAILAGRQRYNRPGFEISDGNSRQGDASDLGAQLRGGDERPDAA